MNARVSEPVVSPRLPTDTTQALALFDTLAPASVDFMLGRWKGEGVPTGHPMDGLLESFAWHGKEFVSAEEVHPLVFEDGKGGLVRLDPRFMPMKYARHSAFSRHALTRKAFQAMIPLVSTRQSRARLRMLEVRGVSTATMIYDDLPINDSFRRMDDNTVLGLMDLKGVRQPFFFLLRRESR
jgi:hypothetical protein